ncbi:MAG TPA: hypothetical protein VGM82_12975 [Gemmatimonadaceae bacterium]|jgi:hypothetical protein
MRRQSNVGDGKASAIGEQTGDGLLHFALPKGVADAIKLNDIVRRARGDGDGKADGKPDGDGKGDGKANGDGKADGRFSRHDGRREIAIDCSRAIADAVVTSLVTIAREGDGSSRAACAIAALQVLRAIDGFEKGDGKGT